VTDVDPYELAAEADALDVEPDEDETKVVRLIPEGLERDSGFVHDPGEEAFQDGSLEPQRGEE
jgi:hypothetical protein